MSKRSEVGRRKATRNEPTERFEIANQWIGKVEGSKRYYRFWYDARAAEVRRRSLGTTDFEEAKLRLAEEVLTTGSGPAKEPSEVPLSAVFARYFEEHTDLRPNPSGPRRAAKLLFEFLGDQSAAVSWLTKTRQREFLRWLVEKGYSVGYISRMQVSISAAINRSIAEDDDEEGYLLTRAPRIIKGERTIAALLQAPAPIPENWHPDVEMLAAYFDVLPEDEDTRLRRFTILQLMCGRPDAVKELRSEQIDERHRLIVLNDTQRRQTNKYRATLPVPDMLWPQLDLWRCSSTLVNKDGEPVRVLRKPWHRYREKAGLPKTFVPKCLRHMLATELRRRRVPREEREMWQGHRRPSTNDENGVFDPEFLGTAKNAVNDLLMSVDKAAKCGIFRQVSAKLS